MGEMRVPPACVPWGPGWQQAPAYLPALVRHWYQWVNYHGNPHSLQISMAARVELTVVMHICKPMMHICNPINRKAGVGGLRSAWDTL